MDGPSGRGLYGLLALPDSSTLLHFSSDFSQVDAIESDTTGFDLAFRTLHAHQTQSGLIIQATESSLALISGVQSSLHSLESRLGIAGIRAENAFCASDVIVLSTHNDGQSQLHTMHIEGLDIKDVNSWDIAGEVTCVSLFTISDDCCVITGSVVDGAPWISVYTLDGKAIVTEAVDKISGKRGPELFSKHCLAMATDLGCFS